MKDELFWLKIGLAWLIAVRVVFFGGTWLDAFGGAIIIIVMCQREIRL